MKLRVLIATYPEFVFPRGARRESADSNIDWRLEYDLCQSLTHLGHKPFLYGVSRRPEQILQEVKKQQIDIVFNLVEEINGRPAMEANVASLFELVQVPFTGCESRGLLLARDKVLTKQILSTVGIRTPLFATIEIGEDVPADFALPYPLIVKSRSEESSRAISQASVVKNRAQLEARVKHVHRKLGTDALVEQYIDGDDLYIGFLGNGPFQIFPPRVLQFGSRPKFAIASWRTKWDETYRKNRKIRTSLLSAKQLNKLGDWESACRAIGAALGITGYCRLDFRMTHSGELFFLEANPNPHLAKDEDFALSAKATGMDYEKLVDRILRLGLEKNRPLSKVA